ncbi:class II aldolase/adducin family protein [Thermanaerovibrio acidaminovorans DSM 6589]|uniref:Class II aldolase/adducin family protein n=1 Tax=Thermanaerovibrio acidaminovorans (strain ATCC 49978 / DSM 6589 / Su883) TaxID=525903 RepID=D1B8F8_THEAS|nr:class II aldolase/adducin family protein [Thermanaerovibrio acidaminovorans DSM 6589]
MDVIQAKRAVVRYGALLEERGLVFGSGGNLSVRAEGGLWALKPSGRPCGALREQDVTVLDMEGRVLEGLKPSSEWRMHLGVLRARSDVGAVFHTHSRFAVTMGCLKWEVPPIHYYMAAFGDQIIPVVPYRPFGSQELADLVAETLREPLKGAILANHGAVVAGSSPQEAMDLAVNLEFLCEVYWRVRCVGNPATLSEEEFRRALADFGAYSPGSSGGL